MTDRPPRDLGEFHEIAKLHEPYLHVVALRLTGDRESAKDLVQDTLARALFHFASFKQGSNARAWMTTILTRIYYDQRKHEKVVTKAGVELVTQGVASEPELALPHVSDAALWNAVNELDPDLRAVVECCYLQGLRYKEAADKLNVPIGTVATRLMRARKRLKALLREEE